MIRRVTEQDIPYLLDIEMLCFHTDRFNKKRFLYFLSKSSKNLFYVIEDNSKIIGYILTAFKSNVSLAYIYSIAILPEFQRNDYGNKLLLFVEEKLKEIGKNRVHCEVRIDNKASKAFFVANKFEKYAIRKNYYEDGCDAYCYKKDLVELGP